MISATYAAVALSVLLVSRPIVGLAIVVASAVFVVGLRSTSISVGCILLSIPIQDAGALTFGSLPITWTKVVVAAAALAWLFRVLADPTQLQFDVTSAVFLAFVVILMASVVNAREFGAWVGDVYRWGVALIVYLMAISALRDGRFPTVLVGASAVAVIGTSVVGFSQVLTGAGPPSFEARGLTRAYGAFGEPNPFAGYLEMTVPLLGAVAVSGLRYRNVDDQSFLGRWLWWLATLAAFLGGIALVLTQSRGGLLGLLASMFVMLMLTGHLWSWVATGFVVFAAALLLVTPFGSNLASGAFGTRGFQQVTPANYAEHERLAHWKTGVAMTNMYPALGVGAGNYSVRYREFARVWRFRISRGHAHNTYIHTAAQSGWLGLLGYVGLLGTAVWRLLRSLRFCRHPMHRALVVGAVGVTAAVMVHGMFDYLHVLSLGLQLSAIWALGDLSERDWREPES
ncbi:MAG: O-antigen ligase family protein [Thermomicrobiales bacterium]